MDIISLSYILLLLSTRQGSTMKYLSTLLISLILSTSAFASELSISEEYVRATPPHTKNSAAFLTITNNTSKNIKLVSATSNIAERVELHNHIKEDGMMKMRQVNSVMLKAHSTTALQPGGYHVMFLGLKNNLSEGNKVNFTLYFDNGDEITLNAPVKKITMSSMSHKTKHH